MSRSIECRTLVNIIGTSFSISSMVVIEHVFRIWLQSLFEYSRKTIYGGIRLSDCTQSAQVEAASLTFRLTYCDTSSLLHHRQRLGQVRDKVVRVLDAHRQPDRGVEDANAV